MSENPAKNTSSASDAGSAAQGASVAFLVAGLALFGWTLWAADLSELSGVLPALRDGGIAFLLVYLFMCAWDVAGWHVLFAPKDRARVRFGDLYLVRLAGEALNNVTPFLDVGGEPLKVSLLSRRTGLGARTVLASVVLERSVLFYSEVPFWMLGFVLGFHWFSSAKEQLPMLAAVIALGLVLSTLLFRAQKRGFFRMLMRPFSKLGLARVLEPFRDAWHETDHLISSAYRERPGAIALSFTLHFAGWVAGTLETWILFRILGHPVGWAEALAVEAGFHLIRTATFFIPGNLGAQEAGLGLVTRWMGLGLTTGLGLSVLKRLRQLIWTAVGFAIWSRMRGDGGRRGRGKKSDVVDTPLDAAIHRPPARVLASFFARTPVTPNQLTLFSLIPAVAAAWFLSQGTASAAAAIACFYLAEIGTFIAVIGKVAS